jgi:hypothetical protein
MSERIVDLPVEIAPEHLLKRLSDRTGRGRQTLIWICPPASPDAAKSGVGDEMSVPGS